MDFLTPWTSERKGLARTLFFDGLSASEIANELGGTTRNAVIGALARMGIKRGRSEPKPKHVHIVRRDVDAAMVKRINDRKQNRVAIAPAPIVEVMTRPDFLGIAFLDLKPEHCRFPKGEGADMLFCGQPKLEDSSYCAYCHKLTHAGFRKLDISDDERKRRRLHGLRIASGARKRSFA